MSAIDSRFKRFMREPSEENHDFDVDSYVLAKRPRTHGLGRPRTLPADHPTAPTVDTKIHWLLKNPLLMCDHIILHGEHIPVKTLSVGTNHKIYELEDGSNRILKTTYSLRAPKKTIDTVNNILLNDIRELELAAKHNIPMPKCYVRPDTYDPECKERYPACPRSNGGFFIMEKIPHKVEITWTHKTASEWTAREKNIFNLVAFILNLHIAENKEIAPDFYPRNVLVRDDDTPVVVDFHLHDPDEDLDVLETPISFYINEKLNAWCGENAEVRKYITDQLPGDYIGA